MTRSKIVKETPLPHKDLLWLTIEDTWAEMPKGLRTTANLRTSKYKTQTALHRKIWKRLQSSSPAEMEIRTSERWRYTTLALTRTLSGGHLAPLKANWKKKINEKKQFYMLHMWNFKSQNYNMNTRSPCCSTSVSHHNVKESSKLANSVQVEFWSSIPQLSSQ